MEAFSSRNHRHRRGGQVEVKAEMPTFTSKNAPLFNPETWRLTVDGLVETPLSFSFQQILGLEKAKLECDFECVEGWKVPKNVWDGVRLRTVLGLAKPLPEARFVMAKAGEFSICISLEEAKADDTLLAYSLKGRMLDAAHGAPLRLVFPKQDCFQSVKWVYGLTLLRDYEEGTGRAIALTRIGLKP